MAPAHLSMRRITLCVALTFVAVFSISVHAERECPVRITLLDVNDVYQFAPVDNGARGGIARVSTLRSQIMAESPHTLFLLAGDTISPSIESNTYQGRQMIDAWNTSGLDYATFGNHEFDFGPDVLRERVKESKFHWLAANVIDRRTGRPFGGTPEYLIREFEGVRIGIFGLVLPETKNTSLPGPDVDFLDPCATATRIVPEIHAHGAEVVIALTHLAMRQDKQLARCSSVDVIVGGHEHTLLESMAGHAPIFKMTSDARELGRIDLNISRSTGKLESIDWKVIPVTDQVPEDPRFAVIYRKYGGLLKELEQRAGHTDVELDVKTAALRTRETNMGDFIADAFRQATGADVALVNGGSIRADEIIKPGDLTRRDLLSTLPFGNRVVKLQVTGAILRAALENGVGRSAEDAEPGRFPQVSGIRYTFDARRPAGSRITSATVDGKPLDERKSYSLATTTYLAVDGGDEYKMLVGAKFLIQSEQGEIESEILQKAVSSVRSIAPKTDGRIKRLDTPKDQSSCN